MNYNHLHYQTGINLLSGVGPKKAKDLLSSLDSIETLFHEKPERLSKLTGYKPGFFKKMGRIEALEASVDIVRFHQEKGIVSHFYTEDSYPVRLKNCDDGPLTLYSLGNISLNDHRFVAIVGTREGTSYGRDVCELLVKSFIGKNIVVVSGLAYGIDSWAHHFSLKNDVPTIAVLGHGLDRIYPYKNRSLAKEIIQNGSLLTEFVPGTNPDRENFPKRNRIVAGMCDATIVVESKPTGGSLITAFLAGDYNRDVFAFPGNIDHPFSQGCNLLIRNHQAQLLDSPESFLNQMGWSEADTLKSIQRKVFPNLSPFQMEIISILEKERELQVDLLAMKMKRSVSEINAELLCLEIEGAVRSLSGHRYCLP